MSFFLDQLLIVNSAILPDELLSRINLRVKLSSLKALELVNSLLVEHLATGQFEITK